MENPRALKTSSRYCKGFYVGLFLSLATYVLNRLFERVGEELNLWRLIVVIPWLALMSPTWALCRLLHIPWNAGATAYETPWYLVLSIILVNSAIGALIWRTFEWAYRRPKQSAR